MGREPIAEWLKRHIGKLCDLGNMFADDWVTLEYGPHTLLKLIAVEFYADMFTKIAKGGSAHKRGYDGALYLDLFAGPGIVNIKGTNDRIAGSPIVATSAKSPFDYAILVESDPQRSQALARRLSNHLSKDKFLVVEGDCNQVVDGIVETINERWRKPIILTFLDPEGMELKWATIEKLSRAFASLDFIINLTSGAARVAGRLASGKIGDRPIFQDFFGDADAESVLLRIAEGQNVPQIYAEGVKNVLGRPLGATIPVRDVGDRVVYHLLGYTRASFTGSPWSRGFISLREKIGATDGEMAMTILNIVKGRQGSL